MDWKPKRFKLIIAVDVPQIVWSLQKSNTNAIYVYRVIYHILVQ